MEDLDAIRSLRFTRVSVAAKEVVVRKGDRPDRCCLVVGGFLVRSIIDGSDRQILSVHMSGDIPDLQSLHLHVLDHDLMTQTAAELAFVRHDDLRAVMDRRPALRTALWRETLIEASLFREWIVNMGRRTAVQRLAHLIVELARRIDAVGLKQGNRYPFPFTQPDIADAIGITPVHCNRMIQELRRTGVIFFESGSFELTDPQRLMSIGQFDPLYLHHPAAG